MAKIKVKRSFKAKSPGNLSTFGHNVVTKMTGNTNFTTPDVPLGTITSACNVLDGFVQAAVKGSKVAHDNVKAQVKVVINLLEEQAVYVDKIANGDNTKIESAGYECTKGTRTKLDLPEQALIKKVTSTQSSTIDIELAALKNIDGLIALAAPTGGLNAAIENNKTIIINPTGTSSQVVVGYGKGHKLTLTGLNSGMRYDVIVFGYNTAGKGQNSTTVSVVVQ